MSLSLWYFYPIIYHLPSSVSFVDQILNLNLSVCHCMSIIIVSGLCLLPFLSAVVRLLNMNLLLIFYYHLDNFSPPHCSWFYWKYNMWSNRDYQIVYLPPIHICMYTCIHIRKYIYIYTCIYCLASTASFVVVLLSHAEAYLHLLFFKRLVIWS